MSLSSHQRDLLIELDKGATIKYSKETGRWLCCLPNGMGFLVRNATMNSLYHRLLIHQLPGGVEYVISNTGRAALAHQSAITQMANAIGSAVFRPE